jgi:hypothetical protein
LRRLLIALLVLAIAGCSARSGTSTDDDESPSAASNSSFGTLKDICGPGTAKPASVTGVTDTQIKLGVFSDLGFTKNNEFPNAAKVFTSWCNSLGGINGRKLVAETLDAKYIEVRQKMLTACGSDFALVGGGAALDSLGVKDRLKCLLPVFPGQTVQTSGSDLQVEIGGGNPPLYSPYGGFYTWLLKEAYPATAGSVGIITGDSPVTKPIVAQDTEVVESVGGKVIYSDLYPPLGASDWTPYAQSIKSKKVKGLIFLGDPSSLAKLEQSLTNIGYKLDWIDTNSNSYSPDFLRVSSNAALAAQNNLADLGGVYPLETSASNPATKQLTQLYSQYVKDERPTLAGIRAFSSWLLFGTAVKACPELTRKCVLDAAKKQTAWTAGGLQAPVDLSTGVPVPKCFNVVKATTQGWTVADFKPDNGAYRCNVPPYKFKKHPGKPVTLADVGKSESDLK